MSLRDLGVFAPLKADHPIAATGDRCWVCGMLIGEGSRIGLKPFRTSDETGSLTVEAKPVCGTCLLRGVQITTPKGQRIVDYVKSGDGSPFPVVTTDGLQFRDEEVNS